MAGDLQPLDEKFAIVGPDGRPTIYFIKWAQQRQIDITEGITEQTLVEYLMAHILQEGSGIQITPDGAIPNSPTIAADVQEILDQITTTQGSILYRNASDWVALAPGAAGLFLQTAGAGANPLWAAAGGGSSWGNWTDLTFGAPAAGIVTANETFVLAAGKTLEVDAELLRVENEGQEIQIHVGANQYKIAAQNDSNLVIYRPAGTAINASGSIATFEYTGLMKLFFSFSTRSTVSNYMYGVQNNYRFPVAANSSDGSANMIGTATIKIMQNTNGSVLRARARLN